jgi:hypothetical protein
MTVMNLQSQNKIAVILNEACNFFQEKILIFEIYQLCQIKEKIKTFCNMTIVIGLNFA